MKNLLRRFWADDDGAVSTIEFLLIATILALGVIPGLTAVRNAIVIELAETAAAINDEACDEPVECIDNAIPSFIDQGPPCS